MPQMPDDSDLTPQRKDASTEAAEAGEISQKQRDINRMLLNALKNNNLAEAEKLLTQGLGDGSKERPQLTAPVVMEHGNEISAAWYAFAIQHPQTIELLIKHGVDLNKTLMDGIEINAIDTLLRAPFASEVHERDSPASLETVITKGNIDLLAKDSEGNTPLFKILRTEYISEDQSTAITNALEKKLEGVTLDPMYLEEAVARSGNKQLIKCVINHSGDIKSYRNEEGDSAFQSAVSHGNYDAINALLESNYLTKSHMEEKVRGHSLFSLIFEDVSRDEDKRESTVVNLIKKADELGVDLKKPINGQNNLDLAAYYKLDRVYDTLKKMGLEHIEPYTNNEATLLRAHMAFKHQDYETVTKILDSGFDVNTKNEDGEHLLHLISRDIKKDDRKCSKQCENCFTRIASNIHDINQPDSYLDFRAVEYAVQATDPKFLSILAENGADVLQVNRSGRTLLQMGIDNEQSIEMLGNILKHARATSTSPEVFQKWIDYNYINEERQEFSEPPALHSLLSKSIEKGDVDKIKLLLKYGASRDLEYSPATGESIDIIEQHLPTKKQDALQSGDINLIIEFQKLEGLLGEKLLSSYQNTHIHLGNLGTGNSLPLMANKNHTSQYIS